MANQKLFPDYLALRIHAKFEEMTYRYQYPKLSWLDLHKDF